VYGTALRRLAGVISTTSGYMGGTKKNPSYEEVSSGTTGHAEVVQVLYDPKKVSYEKAPRSVLEKRRSYRAGPAVLRHRKPVPHRDLPSHRRAETPRRSLQKVLAKTKPFREDIVTPVVPAGEFWPAEDYHQDFYVKNPVRYKFYRTGCGRDARLKQLWGACRIDSGTRHASVETVNDPRLEAASQSANQPPPWSATTPGRRTGSSWRQ